MGRKTLLVLCTLVGAVQGLIASSVFMAFEQSVNRGVDQLLEKNSDLRFVSAQMVLLGITVRKLIESRLEAARGRFPEALEASDVAVVASQILDVPKAPTFVMLERANLLARMDQVEAALGLIEEFSQRRDEPLMAVVGPTVAVGLLEREGASAVRILAEVEKARVAVEKTPLHPTDRLAVSFLVLPVAYGLYRQNYRFGSTLAAQSVKRDLEEQCHRMGLPLCQLWKLAFPPLEAIDDTITSTIIEQRRLLPQYRVSGISAPEGVAQEARIYEPVCAWREVTLASKTGSPSGDLSWSSLVLGPVCRYFRDGKCVYNIVKDVVRWNLEAGLPRDAALSLWVVAHFLWSAGHQPEAIAASSAAVACFEEHTRSLGNSALVTAAMGRGRAEFYYDQLVEMLLAEERFEEAFHVSERSRSSRLLLTVGSASAVDENPPRSDLTPEIEALKREIAREERAWGRYTNSILRRGSALELASLRAALEGKVILAASQAAEFADVTIPKPQSLAEIQKEIGTGTALVAFYQTDLQTFAWVVEHDSFAAFTLDSPDTDLTAVPCFADFVRRGRGAARVDRHCADGQVLAESLYRQLIAPLRGAIHHSRLILVPHGQLHFVPFGALRNPETGRLLVEDCTITHAPSASVLQFLREKESSFEGRALVLGDPSTADLRLERLPASGLEAVVVAGQFETVPRLGPMAAEAELDHLSGEVDVLHLAAHGVYEPASPRFSRIALAPGGGHDGNLEVHEIYSRLDLKGVNLVVLSACDTALGEPTGGDEIVGLTRALVYAGASGVVSTLWRVDDQASTELMVAFYRHLRAGETAAQALRHAQLEMMGLPSRENPYYWAGFVLTGDPRARWEADAL